MLARVKTVLLVILVAGGVLVPLFGDPRSTPVTHSEWARMILRALDLEHVVDMSPNAAKAFAVLSWKNSLAYPAQDFLRGEGVVVEEYKETKRVVGTNAGGEVAYPIAVVRGGNYRLRLRMSGNPDYPAHAEMAKVGKEAFKDFTVIPGSVMGWVEAGATHLDPGAYHVSVQIPPGTALEYVEVAPPCVASIEPIGGWRPTSVAITDDIAVTTLKAVNLEHELPPADSPIMLSAAAFQADDSSVSTEASTAPADEGGGSDTFWIRATGQTVQAVLFLDLPEDGLYSLYAYGLQGSGMTWLADQCRKSIVCGWPEPDKTEQPKWFHVTTGPFSKGRHFFTVVLGPGAAVNRVRMERKKDTPADYLATLRRLGFDPGADGTAITRARAADAMDYIRGRKPDELVSANCVEIRMPEAGAAGSPTVLTQTSTPQTTTSTPTFTGDPPPAGNLTPPVTFPTPPPASPTPNPVPTPSCTPCATPPCSPSDPLGAC